MSTTYPQRGPARLGEQDGGFAPSIRRSPRPSLPAASGLRAAAAALSPVPARLASEVPGPRASAAGWRRGQAQRDERRRDGERARAAGARARPGQRRGRSARQPARRSRAQRTRLGPGGNCCSPRELGGGSESPVPRGARGQRRSPFRPSPPPACRGPRRSSARAAGTPGRGGGRSPDALRSRGEPRARGRGVREPERPLRSERGALSPAATHPRSRP